MNGYLKIGLSGARRLTAIIVAILFMTSAVIPMISTAETGQTTAAEENIDSFIIHCYVSDDNGVPVENALVIFTNMRTGNAEYVETNDTNLASVDVAAIDGGCIAFDTISIVAMGDLSSANTTVVVDPGLDEVTVTLVLTDYSQPSLPSVERDLVLPDIGPLPPQWGENDHHSFLTWPSGDRPDVPPPEEEPPIINITPPTPPRIPQPSKEEIVLPNPDFTMMSLKTSELTILEGDVVSTKFFIDNVGLLWYEEIPVAIYDGDISLENLVAIDTAVFEEFSTDVSFVLSNLSKGTHPLIVFVDPYNEVEEQNEDNNTIAFTVRVTTTEDWPLSIIELIELLMAKVDTTLDKPFSDIVNNNLMKAIGHLEDAAEEYENGNIVGAIESVNDAMDRVYKAATEVKQLYKKGEISLSDAKDIWGDAGIILERIVDLGRLYLDDPLADEVAKVEKYILEIRIGAMIEMPDNNFWSSVDAHLSTSLIHFQEAMEELAGDKDPTDAIQTGYDALNRAREKLSTLVSEGKIPEEFGNWALEIIGNALLVFAPDVVITPENITLDGLAVVGKTSVISIVVENSGRTDVDEVTVEVYDETEEVLLASKTIHQLKKNSQTTLYVDWTPSEIGTHYICVSADPSNEVFEANEENNVVRRGFHVVRGTVFVDDVYVPLGDTLVWDEITIPNLEVVVSGNITVDGLLIIRDDVIVTMNCTYDNQYRIQINPGGKLDAEHAHFTSLDPLYTYSFMIFFNSAMDLYYSTVQWTWGDTSGNIWSPGGIQLYSNNVYIFDSEIYEGKTHGIFVGYGTSPSLISDNTIRDNPVSGICYDENAGGTINYNNISGNTYGVYCYQASPTIMNNENISWNSDSGIYCHQASPDITGNSIKKNQYGINFIYDSNSVVSNNKILENVDSGVRCFECVAVSPTIRDNPMIADNSYGVYAYKSSPLVENNYLTGHSQAVLGQWSSATVTKNNIYGNIWGIETWECPSALTVSENIIRNNDYGIWSHQSDSTFENNPDISENDYGIYIRTNSNPTVTNNTITANRYGIYGNESSPSIVGNDISFNGVTTVFDDMSMFRYMENETVYGPAVGDGTDPTIIYLDNMNIIDCSLYVDVAGEWMLLVEGIEYTLNYATGEIDVTLIAPMEAGWIFYAYYNVSGWTADGFWHQVENVTGAPEWNISHSGNKCWWYGRDATGNYDNGSRNSGNLTSPEFYLPEDSILTFWSWYETEPEWRDHSDLRGWWINVSGTEWEGMSDFNNYELSMRQWVHHRIHDLSYYGGNQIQLNFSFITMDKFCNDYQGWYIDDVAVVTPCGSGIYLENNSTGVLCANNDIKENAYGIILREGSNITMDNGNHVDSNLIYGVYAENSSFELAGSTVRMNQYGIYCHGNTSSLIENNDIINNSDYGIFFDDHAQVDIKDCRISGSGFGRVLKNGCGIFGVENTNSTIYNCSVLSNQNGITIRLWYKYNISPYSFTNITNCNVSYNEINGIFFDGGNLSSSITNNTVNKNLRGILCNGGPTVVNNTITENRWGIFTTGGIGLSGRPPTIQGNIIDANEKHGIYIYIYSINSPGVRIIENRITNNGDCGVYSYKGSADVINNTIANNNNSGIFFYKSHPTEYGNISDNDISSNRWGITCFCTDPPILNNTVTNNTEIGILCADSTQRVEGNEIRGNRIGVVCSGNATLEIIDNEVIGNDEWGLVCYDESNATISNNLIELNTDGGIYSHRSSPSILDNNISLSEYGVYLYLSSPAISGNQITSNSCDGICSYHSSPTIENNTILSNLNGITAMRLESNILDAEYIDGTGYAIVIGSANNFGYPQYDKDSMPAQALQAYYVLKDRGYTDDRIRFLLFHDDERFVTGCEPDEDNDGTDEWVSIYNISVNDLWGLDGIEGTADDPVIDIENYNVTKDRLRAELNNLAEDVAEYDKVLVYLVNHGTRRGGLGGFYFETGREIAWEHEVNDWLQEIQRNCSKMYVLVDACYSGNFISSFSDPHRVSVSASGDCVAWAYVEATATHWAGEVFFHPFWENINAGYSIQDAYELTAESLAWPDAPPDHWMYNKTIREIQDPQLQEGLDGITAGTDPIVIVHNNIVDNTHYGIYLMYSNNNTIANNNVSNCWTGINLESCSNNTIANNNVSSNNGYGIRVAYFSNDNTIANNTASSNMFEGIRLTYSNGNTIYNNNASNNNVGIYVSSYSSGNNITNNNASNNAHGIYLVYSSGNTVTNNTVFLNTWRGICLTTSSSNTIINNNVSNNYQGIYLYSSDSNTITNNIALNNNYGIWLYFSTSNIIANNTASNNGYGIWLWNANSNTIANNTVSNNYNGVRCRDSNNNNIYHNNIIDNTIQVQDTGINFWDNGYSDPFDSLTDGGNYWSDYTGVDLYSGPNQDIPGNDGIGDTPYMFNFAQDNYPLMEPWSP